jgi:hypothetical protein
VPLDQTPIGTLAATLMGEIEQAMGDEGEIGVVGLMVEVHTTNGRSQMFTMFNDSRFHIRLGMLEFARTVVVREIEG